MTATVDPALGWVAFLLGFFRTYSVLQTAWLANPAFWTGFILISLLDLESGYRLRCFGGLFCLGGPDDLGRAPRPPHACTSCTGVRKDQAHHDSAGLSCWLASMALFLSGCTVQLMSIKPESG